MLNWVDFNKCLKETGLGVFKFVSFENDTVLFTNGVTNIEFTDEYNGICRVSCNNKSVFLKRDTNTVDTYCSKVKDVVCKELVGISTYSDYDYTVNAIPVCLLHDSIQVEGSPERVTSGIFKDGSLHDVFSYIFVDRDNFTMSYVGNDRIDFSVLGQQGYSFGYQSGSFYLRFKDYEFNSSKTYSFQLFKLLCNRYIGRS